MVVFCIALTLQLLILLSVVCSKLYNKIARSGEIYNGFVVHRNTPRGEPELVDYDAKISPPKQLIPVVIEIEPDNQRWYGLYCPARKMVIGPDSHFNITHMQETFELVLIENVLHLRPGSDPTNPHPPNLALGRTLCGIETYGEPVPYHCPRTPPGFPQEEQQVDERDLYAEWESGYVCQKCLLNNLVLFCHNH